MQQSTMAAGSSEGRVLEMSREYHARRRRRTVCCPTSAMSFGRNQLLLALLDPDLHSSLTPRLILTCDNTELFAQLPLILAAVQRVGETRGKRHEFIALVHALRARVASCRAIKLRFILLTKLPSYQSFWDIKLMHRRHAYPAAWATLAALRHAHSSDCRDEEQTDDELVMPVTTPSQNGPFCTVDELCSTSNCTTTSSASQNDAVSIPSRLSVGSVSEVALEWYQDKQALYRYAVNELFKNGGGVPMRDHMRHLRVHRNSFYASELVDTVMERVNFTDRAQAVEIAQQLQDAKLITRVSGSSSPFADNNKLYQSKIALHRMCEKKIFVKTSRGEPIACLDDTACSSPDEQPIQTVQLAMPCDMIDLQSIDFWRESVYLSNPTLGHSFGYRSITHPMRCCQSCMQDDSNEAGRSSIDSDMESIGSSDLSDISGNVSDWTNSASTSFMSNLASMSSMPGADLFAMSGLADHSLSHGVISNVVVKKVFSSIARPMIVELRQVDEDAVVDSGDYHSAVSPNLLIKEGDNLGLDLSVELMFQCFNVIWRESAEFFPSSAPVPYAFTYDVFPTGVKKGFMEAVSGLTSLKDFNWHRWLKRVKEDAAVGARMVASAAGSYVAAAIVGAADRHQENVQIRDDGTMLHIDFGYILGARPPIDGPRFSIYPEMRSAFEKANLWDLFVNTCVNAFLAVRRQAPAVIRTAALLFTKFGQEDIAVRDFLHTSLNTHEPTEFEAGNVVRMQIMQSSSAWKTKFKSYSHDKIDPAFYAALERGFPPAVLAMKIVDAKQSGSCKKRKSVATSISVPGPRLALEL